MSLSIVSPFQNSSSKESLQFSSLNYLYPKPACNKILISFAWKKLTKYSNIFCSNNKILVLKKFACEEFHLLIFFFSSSAFPGGFRGQQVQVKPPDLLVRQHRLHFAWTKSQTVPTKILDIIKPSCLWSSNWHFFYLR